MSHLIHQAQAEAPQIYFARAMEGIRGVELRSQASQVRAELADCGFEMLDPYVIEGREAGDDIAAIVEGDLALLAKASAVLMDMTVGARNYIGCVCELVYSYSRSIPVFVYVGNSGYEHRKWLRYHSTTIVLDRTEALAAMSKHFDVAL